MEVCRKCQDVLKLEGRTKSQHVETGLLELLCRTFLLTLELVFDTFTVFRALGKSCFCLINASYYPRGTMETLFFSENAPRLSLWSSRTPLDSTKLLFVTRFFSRHDVSLEVVTAPGKGVDACVIRPPCARGRMYHPTMIVLLFLPRSVLWGFLQ